MKSRDFSFRRLCRLVAWLRRASLPLTWFKQREQAVPAAERAPWKHVFNHRLDRDRGKTGLVNLIGLPTEAGQRSL
jgi:hypothetical protein